MIVLLIREKRSLTCPTNRRRKKRNCMFMYLDTECVLSWIAEERCSHIFSLPHFLIACKVNNSVLFSIFIFFLSSFHFLRCLLLLLFFFLIERAVKVCNSRAQHKAKDVERKQLNTKRQSYLCLSPRLSVYSSGGMTRIKMSIGLIRYN